MVEARQAPVGIEPECWFKSSQVVLSEGLSNPSTPLADLISRLDHDSTLRRGKKTYNSHSLTGAEADKASPAASSARAPKPITAGSAL